MNREKTIKKIKDEMKKIKLEGQQVNAAIERRTVIDQDKLYKNTLHGRKMGFCPTKEMQTLLNRRGVLRNKYKKLNHELQKYGEQLELPIREVVYVD